MQRPGLQPGAVLRKAEDGSLRAAGREAKGLPTTSHACGPGLAVPGKGGCCYLIARLCLILWNPLDCSLPGSCVHGISQAMILEWVDISYFRGSSRPWDRTRISCTSIRISSQITHNTAASLAMGL